MMSFNSLATAPAIVVFRYRFIGDTVLSIPLLRALRQLAPNAVIHYVASPGSGEVLTHCPYIDRLWYLSNKPVQASAFNQANHLRYEVASDVPHEAHTGNGPLVEAPLPYWQLSQWLRHELPKNSVALVLKRSWSSALLACLSGATHRVGFHTEGRRLLLTHPIAYDKTLPEWQCFLQALQPFGLNDTHDASSELEAWWSPEDAAHAEKLLSFIPEFSSNTPVLPVGLHLTATDETKTLPLSVASEATLGLLRRFPQLAFVCVGAASDSETYETLRAMWPPEFHHRLINTCGQTTLLQSQALLSKLALVLGVDSGTLHMAAAAKTPLVGLYLPDKVAKWLPPVSQTQAIPRVTPLILPITPNELVERTANVLNAIVVQRLCPSECAPAKDCDGI